ncbi:MAG TPA: S53 family peptidase [Pseudonocardiaceae bacterium]|jgi:subtilase family serine protease|nr:S53 family peptidase [Pseudonocardiaceae bacterium]
MRSFRFPLVAAVSLFAATAAAVTAVQPAAATAFSPDLVHIHPTATHVGFAQAAPPTTAQCEAAFQVACYGAPQIETAYDLPALYKRGVEGQGQTIAIVDSFGSPTIQADLNTFDTAYGLPTPKLTVIQPAGAVPPWDPTNSDMVGWAGETTLDVEWAHTIAPKANILLVETPVSETEGTTGFPEIVTAEKYVIDHHLASVISQSFSATEQTFPSKQSLLALRGAYEDAYAHHVTVLAAAGDSGAADAEADGTDNYLYPVTSWPGSDPLVTGIGGTQLSLDANGNHTSADQVWNDTYNVPTQQFIFGDNGPNALAGGGGKSVIFSRPSYQNGVANVVGNQRGVPDISMSGACNGAVDVYQSFPGQPAGWYPTCGTSEATPLFSGIIALTAQVAHHPVGLVNPALYLMSAVHAPGLVDVTKGNNTVSFPQGGTTHTVQGFNAQRGYDLASGVGTVDAAKFVPELAALSFG